MLRIRIRRIHFVFWPPRSGSFYHQAKIVRKTLILTVLRRLYDFLSLKNVENVPSKSNKQNNWSGSCPKFHGSATATVLIVPHVYTKFCVFKTVSTRVSDPHWFNVDPDPDPAFFLIADPDPGFDDLKLKKNYSWKFNFYFLDQKLQLTHP